MAAPGRGSEVKAGRRPPPEAARAVASGLEGASRPVPFWQVRAEGPLGNEKSARRAGLIPGEAGATTGKVLSVFIYRFVYQSARGISRLVPTKVLAGGLPKCSWISRYNHQAFPRLYQSARDLGLGEQRHPALHRGRAVAQGHAPVVQLEAGRPVLAQHHGEGFAENLPEFVHLPIVPAELVPEGGP